MRKVNNYEIISLLMFINITMYLGINININGEGYDTFTIGDSSGL